VHVIARMLGVPDADGELFRKWVHEMLELAPTDLEVAISALTEFYLYFEAQIQPSAARHPATTSSAS
jgi:cytochrome P450